MQFRGQDQMRTQNQNRTGKGFSLVELVIVIVIIGVIAAIAIPRVSRGAKGADESALRSNLAILRNAIEMYASEHGGVFPAGVGDGANSAGSEAAFKNQLLKYSDANGVVSDTKGGAFLYGPYLRKQIPPVPVGINRGKNTVKVADTGPTVGGDTGWVYNYKTGEIIANSDANDESGDKTYDQY